MIKYKIINILFQALLLTSSIYSYCVSNYNKAIYDLLLVIFISLVSIESNTNKNK
jgi:hypothetical protein